VLFEGPQARYNTTTRNVEAAMHYSRSIAQLVVAFAGCCNHSYIRSPDSHKGNHKIRIVVFGRIVGPTVLSAVMVLQAAWVVHWDSS